ncbi:hypothetical protein ALP39_01977 [Pseudomonas marginalis pv. marginalis]|nr:hypothetical protein ALP39_01977 [Pseudomonas marginalis pv. marginalis]
MELHKEQGMANRQGKEVCTGRRSITLRAVTAEYSGVRLRALLTECKIAPMDFAVFLKVSPQRLNNWFARGIPHSWLDRIARLLSVNANWLETGTGDKFLAKSA